MVANRKLAASPRDRTPAHPCQAHYPAKEQAHPPFTEIRKWAATKHKECLHQVPQGTIHSDYLFKRAVPHFGPSAGSPAYLRKLCDSSAYQRHHQEIWTRFGNTHGSLSLEACMAECQPGLRIHIRRLEDNENKVESHSWFRDFKLDLSGAGLTEAFDEM